MNKEELLEMVNATISGNGKQEITGKSLNLALTEIINGMGTGGGGLLLHFLPTEDFTGDYLQDLTEQDRLVYEEYVNHNREVYNTLLDCNNQHKPVPGPIYFDNTFFEWNYNHREGSVRGGIAAYWRIDKKNGEIVFQFGSPANANNDTLYLLPNGLIQFSN